MERTGLIGLAPRRNIAGMTQEKLAEDLGISRSLLAAWEVGRVWPSAKRLPEMARLLGCSVEDLYSVPDAETIVQREEAESPCSRNAEISM